MVSLLHRATINNEHYPTHNKSDSESTSGVN